MIFHTKKSLIIRKIIIHCSQKIAILMFLLLFLQCGLFMGSEASAQSAFGQQENTASENAERKSDFLLGEPKGFFGLHTGMFFPRADSDLFDMITSELTLEKNDFRAWDFGLDFGFDLHEKIDLVVHYDYSKASSDSEFRDFVDEQGLPITQTTSLSQSSITVGVKYLLKAPGRRLGEYAWLPSRFVPFVEGGLGASHYSFGQKGDFVDSETLEIFRASLESSDWTEVIYLGGGTDIYLLKNIYLTLDLRYSLASAELNEDFLGFDDIDLDGFRVTAGIYWHF
jgi:opacity protein-like surface antigen